MLTCFATACSAPDTQADAADVESADPPGAALPLSIGGRAAAEGEGIYDTSVNCAVALGLTAERMAQLTDNPRSREIALMNRAENHFTARAEDAQASENEVVASPTAAIARRRQEKAGEAKEQAQLAIACLRRFGDDVG